MTVTMLKGKIHRAVVTEADVDYVGSITVDSRLLDAAGILEYEKVLVADVDNGERLETYTIAGKADSGIICLNGAAAHRVGIGDKVIIMAFADMTEEEAKTHRPKVVFTDGKNRAVRVTEYEKHGRAEDMA